MDVTGDSKSAPRERGRHLNSSNNSVEHVRFGHGQVVFNRRREARLHRRELDALLASPTRGFSLP